MIEGKNQSWKRRGMSLSAVAIAALLGGCASMKSNSAPVQSNDAPVAMKALGTLGDDAETAYDIGNTADWETAPAKIAALKTAATEANNDIKHPTPGQTAAEQKLKTQLATLDAAIAAKDKSLIMQSANQITLVAADLADPLQPPIPTDVTRLDYLSRELEIWANADNADKLKSTTDQIKTTWNRLKPVVEAADADEAKTFGALVDKEAAAKTNQDYLASSKAIGDEVDKLEEVFQK